LPQGLTILGKGFWLGGELFFCNPSLKWDKNEVTRKVLYQKIVDVGRKIKTLLKAT
jgi:hypothetical protein